MQPAELPSWAEQQAAALLTGLGDRWSHIQAVAEQGRRVSAALAPEDGPLLDALTYADMTTGPAGQRVDLEERIAEILERYPPDDPVHRAIGRSHPMPREERKWHG